MSRAAQVMRICLVTGVTGMRKTSWVIAVGCYGLKRCGPECRRTLCHSSVHGCDF